MKLWVSLLDNLIIVLKKLKAGLKIEEELNLKKGF